MKKFLGFIVDLLIVLLEIAICAGVVFYLVSHPIIKIESKIVESRKLIKDEVKILVTPTPTPRPGNQYIPAPVWIPEYFAPERLWGYDRVYSCTRLQRVPGFWHIGGYPPQMINDCPVYVF